MSFQAIREHDVGGRLVAAGYQWDEHKVTPGIPLYLLTCAGVVAALLGLWVALVGDPVVGAPIIVGGLAIAWWGRRALVAFGYDRRAIVFRVDDTVATLGGKLPVKVSEIINVANDVQFETSYITFSLRDGRKIEAVNGRGLQNDDDGRRVHAELVKAWDEIGQAMATRPRASEPTADRA